VPFHHRDPTGGKHWIHIHLDEYGDSIVSEGVWAQLEEVKNLGLCDHGMFILNEVWDPPTLVIGQNHHDERRTLKYNEDKVLSDAELQAIAQSFAPQGTKARITTRSNGNG
jgi:hypothetical protein